MRQVTASVSCSNAEQQARVDLAAAHRIVHALGWSQLIYNHVTLRLPDEPGHFLIKPNNLMYDEVTASSLIKLRLDGQPANEDSNVNAAGFAIHAAVFQAREDVNAVLHIHTEVGMAIAAHPRGLRFISQGALRFYNAISYHAYSGGDELDEIPALQSDLGANNAMILHHHGLLTCGVNLAEAVSLMRYLYDACKSQLMLEAAVGIDNVMEPSPEACQAAHNRWHPYGRESSLVEWPAMLRWASRLDPTFGD